MPYMVQLPVMDIQDWTAHPIYRDPTSTEFKQWYEYLARSICLQYRDSETCVGYFFVDIPGWARHHSELDFPGLVGLSDEQREERIYNVASAYYSTICTAVRAVDPNYLVFGDRCNGNKAIPPGVLRAAKEHIDVLSVQYFCEPTQESRAKMIEDLQRWQSQCQKPVLVADIGNWCATEMNPHRRSALKTQKERGQDYVASLEDLVKQKWFIGLHWCWYIENQERR